MTNLKDKVAAVFAASGAISGAVANACWIMPPNASALCGEEAPSRHGYLPLEQKQLAPISLRR